MSLHAKSCSTALNYPTYPTADREPSGMSISFHLWNPWSIWAPAYSQVSFPSAVCSWGKSTAAEGRRKSWPLLFCFLPVGWRHSADHNPLALRREAQPGEPCKAGLGHVTQGSFSHRVVCDAIYTSQCQRSLTWLHFIYPRHHIFFIMLFFSLSLQLSFLTFEQWVFNLI